MPYVQQPKRDVLDPIINDLHNALVGLELDDPSNNFEGNMNYIITKLITVCYTATSYREINDVVGMLECVKQEYYRRVAAPYENMKAHDNGDVFPNPIQQEMESLAQHSPTPITPHIVIK